MAQPMTKLCRAVERLCAHPMLAVGSGGSFSVCHFAAHLHGVLAGQTALPMTPLQAVDRRTPVSTMSVLLPTAGGNNPDVVAAVRLLSEQEPQSVLILCGNAHSRVAAQAARYQMVDFIAYELPTGKDGFLATNSLLAFCVLLARAFAQVSGQRLELPKDYRGLLSDRRLASNWNIAQRRYSEILSRRTLLVLHGPATTAAAVDIESKFTEAALGHVQICDFRQFAHGRHHWLAKRDKDTSILTLESPDEEAIATQTLELIPKGLPTARISIFQRDWTADLAAICEGFYLARVAGVQQGIDPGRPGVPAFGRKLYHANAFRLRRKSSALPAWKIRAIERKAGVSLEQMTSDNRLSFWTKALDAVLDSLALTRFCGIVVDYDGTLCSEDDRFDPLPKEITASLVDLLKSGAQLGVATGRGKSVRERLHEAIPKQYWSQVIVGYYNGGHLLPLNSSELPDGSEKMIEDLRPLAAAVKSDPLLTQGAITLRPRQVTLNAPPGVSLNALCEHAEALINRISPHKLRVMRSGHSVDIVPDAVSKLSVVDYLSKTVGINNSGAVLRIGDRGRWPGNDAQLLASPYGLSVHEVSSDSMTCWNLAPPGFRGWQATLWYLRHMKSAKRGIRFGLSAKEGE